MYTRVRLILFLFFFTDIEVQEMQHSQPESSLMRAEDDDDSSDDELLETQTWRVQKLERNEFLDSLKVSCHILEPKQSLLRRYCYAFTEPTR